VVPPHPRSQSLIVSDLLSQLIDYLLTFIHHGAVFFGCVHRYGALASLEEVPLVLGLGEFTVSLSLVKRWG
jgi:hypothetical protein